MKKNAKFGKAMKYIVVFSIAVVVVIIVRLVASRKHVAYVPPTTSVSVMYPTMGTINEDLILNAHIEARAMVPVIPMVSGTILKYPAKAGDIVNKGDLLCEIDKAPFEQQMLQAKAAYKGYESSFTRVEGLYRSGAATRQEYDTLKAQRDAAKAQYDLAELQLSYAKVTAPVNGTVIAAPMAVGSVAGAPNPVAIVADLDDLVVRLAVPEKYYPIFMRNKDSLTAVVARPDYEGLGGDNICNAVVDTIAPYIDGTSKTFEMVLRLKDVPIDFKPGMFVQVQIVFQTYDNVPLIPLSSKLSDGSIYYFVKDAGENQGFITGKVDCITLDKYVSDSNWLMVPREYADKMFVVKGQNNILAGQTVNAQYENIVWDKKKGAN